MLFFINDKTDYTVPSKLRSVDFQGYHISPNRMVKGNSKLHNILIFDLPAVETCLNCNDCKAKCYAMKAQRMYTDTRIFRSTNLALFNLKQLDLFVMLCNQLADTKMTTVRIHSSGDFFSQDYINFWSNIIVLFPHIKFYAYTKVSELFDFSKIESLNNFNLISSIVAEVNINFGSIEYCQSLNKKYNTFICPATSQKDVKVRCGLDCSYCITEKNVCFVEH